MLGEPLPAVGQVALGLTTVALAAGREARANPFARLQLRRHKCNLALTLAALVLGEPRPGLIKKAPSPRRGMKCLDRARVSGLGREGRGARDRSGSSSVVRS